jgi:hypothetical protein
MTDPCTKQQYVAKQDGSSKDIASAISSKSIYTSTKTHTCSTALLCIPETLLLVKQICSRTSQIHNLWTPISVFFQSCTLKAVERVRDSFTAAHHTLVCVVAKGAFVADANKRSRSDVRVADGAFSIAFIAETTD